MNNKFLTAIICLLLTAYSYAQQINVATANLERLKYKTGVMILYYGPNRMVKYCSLWDVKFKKEESEEKIANSLKERVAASDPYMYFEFKEGFDCNNASSYLQKKGVSKMNISSCTYINFSEDKNGTVLQPGNGTAAWNNTDRVAPDYVDQLPTYSWALVNRVVKNKMEQLEKDGWQRVYVEFNLAGGSKNLWVGKALSFSPDSMYKAVATVINSNYYLKLLNFDKPLVEGFPYQEFFNEYKGDSLGETIVFKPAERINKIIAAAVSADEINTNNAGIMVYRKKYNLQDEFQSILDDAKQNFTHYKLYETKDPNGVPVFAAMNVLGLKTQMIFQSKREKQWMYSQFCNTDDPYAATIKKTSTGVVDSFVKTGNYLTESGENDGDMVYRLNDKKENILFQMAVGAKKISLNFFGTGTEEEQKENQGVSDNEKNPKRNENNSTANSSVPFIDNAKNYIFKNWDELKWKYQWNWLETSDRDANVSRFFMNLNGSTDPDSTILRINQKADNYTWALTKSGANKPVNYTFSAVVSMSKQNNSDGGQGLIIQYKDGKKGDPSHLYFIINPMKQTFWFGSQNPNNNKWTTHNHYSGYVYNIYSAAINKYNSNSNDAPITKNLISIKKEANRFLLYINNQLVDTIELDKNNDVLRNFEGIGLVTVHSQESAFERISLSAD